jgi:hypothetical protein
MPCLDEKAALRLSHATGLSLAGRLWSPRELDRVKGRFRHCSAAVSTSASGDAPPHGPGTGGPVPDELPWALPDGFAESLADVSQSRWAGLRGVR